MSGIIRPVEFNSRLHDRLPVEVAERSEVIKRVSPRHLAEPRRLIFESIHLIRSAGGSHVVDFDEVEARPNRLIRVRPGQVQTWNTTVDVDATIVLARSMVTGPSARQPTSWFPGHRSSCDLDDQDWRLAVEIAEGIRRRQTEFDESSSTGGLLVSLFLSLSALFDQALFEETLAGQTLPDRANPGGERAPLPEAYLAFRQAIESDLARHHDVVALASELGYSARTLTRACQQVTGQTAKQVLTDRLVLEAKRMLIHSAASAGDISSTLGFTEPTNFTKFFTRNTGVSPSAFRRSMRPG